MVSGHYRPSPKSTSAPRAPPTRPGDHHQQPFYRRATIKDLRQLNLLNEFFPVHDKRTRVQETVEIIPQPVSCERIFYSYIDDRTDTRCRTNMKLQQDLPGKDPTTTDLFGNLQYDRRFHFDVYSTTLFIFPKQRSEKFISEIRYCPEHIMIKYKTSLEVLASPLHEHYYQNIHDCYEQANEIFYRI